MRNMKNLESIELDTCTINSSHIFAEVEEHCRKLKKIDVWWCSGHDTSIYSHKFPELEELCLLTTENRPNDQLKVFLEKHEKLKHFDVDFDFLWANRGILVATNIRLDVLSIDFNNPLSTSTFDQFIKFLNTLYERGFFKTLALENLSIDNNVNNLLLEFPCETLTMVTTDGILWPFRFKDLKTIKIYESIESSERLARHVAMLEELQFRKAETNVILPFIRHSEKLKTIKIDRVEDNHVLDFKALDRERKMLENACQVTVYVQDDVYLSAKRQLQNSNLKLDLIEIKRSDHFELESIVNF